MMATKTEPLPLHVTVPLHWLSRLQTLRRPGQVWVTALVVLHWHTQTNQPSFWLSSAEFFPMCEMSRHAIRRALKRLEGLGLIRVDRACGAIPRVTVLAAAVTYPRMVRVEQTEDEVRQIIRRIL